MEDDEKTRMQKRYSNYDRGGFMLGQNILTKLQSIKQFAEDTFRMDIDETPMVNINTEEQIIIKHEGQTPLRLNL